MSIDTQRLRRLYYDSQIHAPDFTNEDLARACRASEELMATLYASTLEIVEALEKQK